MRHAMERMAAHSEACTPPSTFSAFCGTPTSLPSHLVQKKNVAAEPKASMIRKMMLPVSAKDTSVAHLEISMPKGATNMPIMPSIMKRVRRGRRAKRPSMSSMLRLPMRCSTVPTHRKSSDLDTVWKMIRKIPAHTASAVPTPAHAAMRPRLAMVE